MFNESFQWFTPTTTAFWFYNNKDLEEIIGMEYINTAEVTSMQFMFTNCLKIKNLDLSTFNTKKVIDMHEMFDNCTKIQNLNVSNWETSNVTNMGYMFCGCENLSSLDLSEFNTKSVTSMVYMFAYCKSLTTIFASELWTIGTTTNTVGIFAYCSLLKGSQGTCYKNNTYNQLTVGQYARIDFPPDNPGYLTYKKNKKVTSINIKTQPTKLTYKNDEDFAPDGGIITVTYEDNTTKELPLWHCSITPIDKIKTGEQTLILEYFGATTTITITRTAPSVWAKWDDATFTLTVGYDANACGQYEHEISIDKTEDDYKDDKSHLGSEFVPTAPLEGTDKTYHLPLTKHVVFDPSFADCRPTNCTGWFANCVLLESIEGMENLNTSEVTKMSYMFNVFNSYLTTIDLSHFNTDKVTSMHGMFACCWGLQSLDLSHFNTDKVITMQGMFAYCYGLQSLDLSSFDTKVDINATAEGLWMNEMFRGCSELKTIYVSEKWDLSNFESRVFYNDTFKDCTALIGGNGTKYDASHTDYQYAHIDGGESNPGYLTLKTKEVKSIAVTTQPTKTTYYIGEDFDPTDGIITITYDDNTTETANLSSAEITAIDQTKIGTQTLTVTYLGKTTEIDITLLEIKAVSIEITSSPNTTYYVGDSFNPDGGELTITYNNGTTQTVALADATITGYNASNTGSQTLTIKYGGVSTTIGVTVLAVDVTSISMSAYPEKTEYTQGESLSLSGGTIYVSYSNGSEEYIALTNAEISGYNPEITGSQTVYVNYGGYETWFTVNVSEKTEPEPEPQPEPEPEPEPQPEPEPEPEPEPQPNPVPVSEIADAPVVKIWSFSNTIYIENAESDITVISTLGSQITKQKPTSTRTEITIPRSGIYIVRTGSTVQKVIIR
ncbi:MAG: bacterial Ig-like domain-containing protein [Bacteroidales bacterium]|nr:bacterial Ig-like domain-containing protein [Bacteroidales bacterium]